MDMDDHVTIEPNRGFVVTKEMREVGAIALTIAMVDDCLSPLEDMAGFIFASMKFAEDPAFVASLKDTLMGQLAEAKAHSARMTQ